MMFYSQGKSEDITKNENPDVAAQASGSQRPSFGGRGYSRRSASVGQGADRAIGGVETGLRGDDGVASPLHLFGQPKHRKGGIFLESTVAQKTKTPRIKKYTTGKV